MQITYNGNTMIIAIDMSLNPPASQSGKTRLVFSTGPGVMAATPLGQCKIGLNVFTADENWAKSAKSAPVAKPGLVKSA